MSAYGCVFRLVSCAVLIAGCSTARTVRPTYTFSQELAKQMNHEAAGRQMDVDLDATYQNQTIPARRLDLAAPGVVGLTPGDGEKPARISSCHVRTVRVPQGSSTFNGALVGGALNLGLFLLSFAALVPDRGEVPKEVVMLMLSPGALVVGMVTGGLIGRNVPQGEIVYPLTPPLPGYPCR